MKTLFILLILCIQVVQQLHSQTVEIKDSSNETLITINDEGVGKSSITIQNSNSVPSITMDKLYNYGHNLYWNGNELGVAGSAGGWTEGGTTVNLATNSDSVGIGTTSPMFKLDITNIIPGGSVEAAVNTDSSGGALAAYSNTFPFPFDHFADRLSLWANGFTASGLDLRADGPDSDMRFYTGGLLPVNEQMRITANGFIGIGTTSPTHKLHLDGQLLVEDYTLGSPIAQFINTSSYDDIPGIYIQIGPTNPSAWNRFITFRNGNGSTIGSVSGDGSGGVQYNTTSDVRLKTNISDFSEGLDIVSKMQVRIYEKISAPGSLQIGFLAQELLEVYPQAVSGSPESDVLEEPMMIDYGRITPILVQAIQEMQVENKQLRERLEALEKTVLQFQ